MIDRDEIQQQIRHYILQQYPLARKKNIQDADSLLDHAIIDSLGILDVVAYLEATFGLRIADDELELDDFGSIQSIARFVERKLRGDESKNAER
jgi:acyl carrier protein